MHNRYQRSPVSEHFDEFYKLSDIGSVKLLVTFYLVVCVQKTFTNMKDLKFGSKTSRKNRFFLRY